MDHVHNHATVYLQNLHLEQVYGQLQASVTF